MPSPAEAGTTFTLQIERSMAGLAGLGNWVDAIVASLSLTRTAEYALRLCVEEAAANVVMHGKADGGSDAGYVALQAKAAGNTLCVVVEDRCRAFNPLLVAASTPPAKLEQARVGGLGIHLMRQYAQAMNYTRTDGVNRLTLTIAR